MDGSKDISQTAWLYSQIIPFPFLPSHITKSRSGFSEVALFTEKYQKSSRSTWLIFVPLNKVTQPKNTTNTHSPFYCPINGIWSNKPCPIFCLIHSSWIKNGDNHPDPDKTLTPPSENYILLSHCSSLSSALLQSKKQCLTKCIFPHTGEVLHCH